MATEIDYILHCCCVLTCFECKSEEIISLDVFWIFGDCFSGGAFSAVDENHLILFSKNKMQFF
jgi:hypothetical protein